MTAFTALNPDFEETVRQSFSQQAFMGYLSAELTTVKPGEVTITLPYQQVLTQQHGFLHAGAVTTIVDTACGYAGLSLMPPGSEVLSVEYKINLVSPAVGDSFIAIGRVLRPGRTLMVCQGEVWGVNAGQQKLCATMLATMIRREGA